MVSRELTALLLSSRPGIKLALVYGDSSDVIEVFNELRSYYSTISSLLRNTTRSKWVTEHDEIMTIFTEKIDPLRASFEEILLDEVHPFAIIKNSFKYYFRTEH